jgi:hypothetical protein
MDQIQGLVKKGGTYTYSSQGTMIQVQPPSLHEIEKQSVGMTGREQINRKNRRGFRFGEENEKYTLNEFGICEKANANNIVTEVIKNMVRKRNAIKATVPDESVFSGAPNLNS